MTHMAIFADFSSESLARTSQQSQTVDQLASYEAGFQAGWDDAVKANQSAQSYVSSALSKNLEAAEFQLIEARGKMEQTLAGLLKEIVSALFPGASSAALRSTLEDRLLSSLTTALPDQISLRISPEDKPCVTRLLQQTEGASQVHLRLDENLSLGQAYIETGPQTEKIDIAETVESLLDTISLPTSHSAQEHTHAS